MDVFDLYAKITLDTSGYDAGLQNASNTTKSFGSKLGSGLKSAAKLATTAFAAISGAAVAATGAFISGAKEVAEYGDNIDKMSQKMGMSAEAYQEWDAVMRHSGTSMETMKAGPLPESILKAFTEAWDVCRKDSPEYFTLYKRT